jgi:hypothetical protein
MVRSVWRKLEVNRDKGSEEGLMAHVVQIIKSNDGYGHAFYAWPTTLCPHIGGKLTSKVLNMSKNNSRLQRAKGRHCNPPRRNFHWVVCAKHAGTRPNSAGLLWRRFHSTPWWCRQESTLHAHETTVVERLTKWRLKRIVPTTITRLLSQPSEIYNNPWP